MQNQTNRQVFFFFDLTEPDKPPYPVCGSQFSGPNRGCEMKKRREPKFVLQSGDDVAWLRSMSKDALVDIATNLLRRCAGATSPEHFIPVDEARQVIADILIERGNASTKLVNGAR